MTDVGHGLTSRWGNRFAYVDFATPELQRKAVGLSETLLDGRKVLIKMGASSFQSMFLSGLWLIIFPR